MTAFQVREWSEQQILTGAFWDILEHWNDLRTDGTVRVMANSLAGVLTTEERNEWAKTLRTSGVWWAGFICNFCNRQYNFMFYSTFSPPSKTAFLPKVSVQVIPWVRYKTGPEALFQGKELLMLIVYLRVLTKYFMSFYILHQCMFMLELN